MAFPAPPRPPRSQLRSYSAHLRKESVDNISLSSDGSNGFTSDASVSTAATSDVASLWPPRQSSLLQRNVSTSQRSECSDDLERITNSVNDTVDSNHWKQIEQALGRRVQPEPDEMEETRSESDSSDESETDPTFSRRHSDASGHSSKTSFSWMQLPHSTQPAAERGNSTQERLRSAVLTGTPEMVEVLPDSRRSSSSTYTLDARDASRATPQANHYSLDAQDAPYAAPQAEPESAPLSSSDYRSDNSVSSPADNSPLTSRHTSITVAADFLREDETYETEDSDNESDNFPLQDLKFQKHLSVMSPTEAGTPTGPGPLSPLGIDRTSHAPLDLPTSPGTLSSLLDPIRESLGTNSSWLAPEDTEDTNTGVAGLLLKRGKSSVPLTSASRDSWLGPDVAASRATSRTPSLNGDLLLVPASRVSYQSKRPSLVGNKRSSYMGSKRSSIIVSRRAASPNPYDDDDVEETRRKIPVVVIDRRKYKRFSGSYNAMYFTGRRTTRDWLGIKNKIDKPRNCLSKKVFENSYNSVLWSGNQRTVDIVNFDNNVPLIKTQAGKRASRAASRNSQFGQPAAQRRSVVGPYAPQLQLNFNQTLPQIPEDSRSQASSKSGKKSKRKSLDKRRRSVQSTTSGMSGTGNHDVHMPMTAPIPIHPHQLQQMQQMSNGNMPYNFYQNFAPPMPSAPASQISGSSISNSRSAMSYARSHTSAAKSAVSFAPSAGTTRSKPAAAPPYAPPHPPSDSPWSAGQVSTHPKRRDLSIRIPAAPGAGNNGPMTAVPSQRRRPPSTGLKSARPDLVSTPYGEGYPIVTSVPMTAGFQSPAAFSATPTEEKRGLFSKMFKRKASKGRAVI